MIFESTGQQRLGIRKVVIIEIFLIHTGILDYRKMLAILWDGLTVILIQKMKSFLSKT